jgi:NAD+ synthase (glutamine-hydrolysing)
VQPSDEDLDELFAALVTGVRDYAGKTGFRGAVLGLSGGIDSALTAAIAARAFGPEAVLGVAMPSRYTASMSNDDAAVLARNLGIRFEVIPIERMFAAALETLGPAFEGRPPDVTEENLQARSRGVILMGLSNKFGKLLLTTGNKSELGVGYCTLYGDMAGGLAVIGDLPKTLVWALSRHVNVAGEVIPWRTIDRPPSAELRENQTDQDSLPPYEVLDRILSAHIVERLPVEAIVARGEDEATVRRVLSLVLSSEYKRRQAAPTLRMTPRAFGEGWRFPIAHGFRF